MEVTWVPIIGLMGGALGSSEGGAVFPGGPYKRVLEVSNIIIRNFAPPNLYGSPENLFCLILGWVFPLDAVTVHRTNFPLGRTNSSLFWVLRIR